MIFIRDRSLWRIKPQRKTFTWRSYSTYAKYTAEGRGLYRIFNAAEYRFYRTTGGGKPDQSADSPFETNATLPYTSTTTWADGTWWTSVAYFNGVIESPFLALGPAGETALRLEVASSAQVKLPPEGPDSFTLEQLASGVIRIHATYFPGRDTNGGDGKATEWAIWRTFDGSAPNPANAPDLTVTMTFGFGFDVLSKDLAAQSHGVTVKVLVRTRRDDPPVIASENTTVVSTTADTTGPAVPGSLYSWRGQLPESE